MVKMIKWVVIGGVAVWVVTHPNTKALIKGLRSSFVEAPMEDMKDDIRKELEQQAREREEAREREINKKLEEFGV